MARYPVCFVLVAALIGCPALAQDASRQGLDDPQTIRDTFVAGTSGNAAIFRVTNSTGQRVTGVTMTPSFPLQWIDLTGVTPRSAELEVGGSVDFTIEFAIFQEAPDGATETVTLFFDTNEDVVVDNPRFQLIVDIIARNSGGGLAGALGNVPAGSAEGRAGEGEVVAETGAAGGAGSAAGQRTILDAARAALESCDLAEIRRAEEELATADTGAGEPVLAMLEKLRREIAADDSFEKAGAAYTAGNLDEVESLLAAAGATGCTERQAQIAEALDKIERLEGVLVKVDSALAACDLGPLRRYGEQLDGRSHVLLVAAKAKVEAMTEPLIRAIAANDAAETTYLSGGLDGSESKLGEALRSLDVIGPDACIDLRQTIAGRFDKIERLRRVLARADDAIAACDVADMGLLRQAFADDRHLLVKQAGRRLEAALPASTESLRLHEESEPPYRSGDFDAAEERLYGAQAALQRSALPGLCPDLSDKIEERLDNVAALRQASQAKQPGPGAGESSLANCEGVLDSWAWPRNTVTILTGEPSGGSASNADHPLISAGSWLCIGPDKIRITWGGGEYVDTMTLSGDILSGANQTGFTFTATRVAQSVPAAGETCEWRPGGTIFPSACVCTSAQGVVSTAPHATCGR